MDRVLAIVVTYNAMRWISSCLGSLVRSSQSVDVLVVDNGSTDGTVDYIGTSYPDIRLIVNEENLGFGAANNIGLRIALDEDYNFVYLLNQDAWVEKDTIAGLMEMFTPGYGILSPVQTDARGHMDGQFAKKCGRFIRSAHQAGKREVRLDVPFVMAAHWMISREAIKRVGGFSPTFTQYGEDDNYIDRLHYHGLKCAVVANFKGVHDRADRANDRRKRMMLKSVAVLVRLSKPGGSFTLRSILAPLELIGMSIKNFSFLPLKSITVLISRYPEIRRNALDSRKEGAFL